MELKIGRCPKCNLNRTLLPSNNSLIAPICLSCIEKEVDYYDMEQASFFCRTYNLPFKPEL